MVCRAQRSRDQCSVSWIWEGDVLCKRISRCEPASQLVNGAACCSALFTRSLQSTLLPPVSPPSPHHLLQPSSQPTVARVIKDADTLIQHTHTHTHTHTHLWSPRFWGHYSTLPSNPFSDFYLFIPSHYTDPFIPITHAAPHQAPWSSDT